MSRLEPIIGVEIIDINGDEIRLGHTFHEVEVLKDFILRENPDFFIEIGIHEGGLSYLLLPILPCYYIGVELNCNEIRPSVKDEYAKEFATLICKDCFNPEVQRLFHHLSKKIIYCDGGNKAKEIAHFQSVCSSGDIIMCHDFWDGTRKVRDVPDENISKEVLPKDVQIYENSTAWERLSEDEFKETRIIGWRKV